MPIYILRATEIINDSRTLKLYRELKKIHKDVVVLGWNRNKINIKNTDIQLYDFESEYGKGYLNLFHFIRFECWLLLNLIKKRKEIDIIHSCDLDTGLVTFIYCKIFKKKYNYDIYDFYVDSHNMTGKVKKIIKYLEFKVIDSSENTIICTNERKQQIIGSLPRNIEIIYNTPDLSKINHEFKLKSNNNKFKIGYVGVLQNHRLLKEICETVSQVKDVELHIGGFGILEKELLENSNIYFYGALEYKDALGLEEKCDILFATYDPQIPNHRYSAPNKLYEACALGKPIIVCKDTGIDKIVSSNCIGEVINYDINEFWKAVAKIKSYDILSNKQKMNEIYEKEFSWANMIKKIEKLYN